MDPLLLPPEILALLALAALVAGFVDAIAGGGGLITLPALLLAGLPPQHALAANKSQSVFGSAMALWRFSRSPLLDRERARVGLVPALLGAVCGAQLVAWIPPRVLAPLVMALLAAVAVLMLVRRPSESSALSGPPRLRHPRATAVGVAFTIAAYDGFFGPGTGTFLIMAYTWLWGDRLDAASANAKLVNCASNFAALVVFAAHGLFFLPIALAMGSGQALGGWLGAHATIRRGQGLVRVLVIGVSIALVVRLSFQLFGSP